MTRPPPISTLFPYPTLSRSARRDRERGHDSSQNQKEIDPNRRCGDTELDQRPWLRVDESSGRRWPAAIGPQREALEEDRKSTRLNSSHGYISYAVFCLKKKT